MDRPYRGAKSTFRPALFLVAAGLVAALAAADAGAAAAGPAESPDAPAPAGPGLGSIREQTIERLILHHLEMYGKHLKSPDWMARAMAVIGLARIDDPRITDQLFAVLAEDKLPVVRVYAWEGLHARFGSLDADQRARWVRAGKDLLAKGHLRGDLRAGLVRALIPDGPTEANLALLRHLFAHTNSMDASDMRTLEAMRDALYHWRPKALCRDLVGAMGQLDTLFRAEYVMGYQKWRPSQASDTFAPKGSAVLLSEVRALWQKAFDAAGDEHFQPYPAKPYEGKSTVLPPAEKITDPSDPKWRQDLELTRFRLDHLDVTLLVDSTGSMTPVIRWVQRDVAKLMRAFYLISQEPRLAIIFYRDRGDEYVVRPFPFTSNADALARAIRKIEAKGGGDEPEAVYDGLLHALTQQKWSSGHYARRIVVVVGDAPPHDYHMKDVEKLVEAAAKKDFRFFCLKVRGQYTAGNLMPFDKIAEWGDGESIWAQFYDDPFPGIDTPDLVKERSAPATARGWRNTQSLVGVARPTPPDAPCRQLVRAIVRTAIPEVYQAKTEPFVDTLLEYLEQEVPERRTPFGPVEPDRHGPGPHRPRDEKPFDPQAR
jgi:hypothetical protein